MPSKSSSILLADVPENALASKSTQMLEGTSKCIIKLRGRLITDIQETKDRAYNLDASKIAGNPVERILPEYQPNGSYSKKVLHDLLDNMVQGYPVSTSLQIKNTENKLHFANVDIVSFEKNEYYLTLSSKDNEVPGIRQSLSGQEAINIQNLISDGSLMFKCYDVDGSVYYLNSAYLDFTATSFNRQLKEGWLASVHKADRDRLKRMHP